MRMLFGGALGVMTTWWAFGLMVGGLTLAGIEPVTPLLDHLALGVGALGAATGLGTSVLFWPEEDEK